MRNENQLVEKLTKFLEDSRFIVSHEIPNMGQSADVVARKGRWVTIIEAKISNWGRAFEQCRAHEHVADYICIAIGTKGVSIQLIQRAELLGYGIIHCTTENCEYVLEPKMNTKKWAPQRAVFSSNLKKIANGS